MVRAKPARCPSCGSIYDENVSESCPRCEQADGYGPVPSWAQAPAYCHACGKLHAQPLGVDVDGDLVCPWCESVDVWIASGGPLVDAIATVLAWGEFYERRRPAQDMTSSFIACKGCGAEIREEGGHPPNPECPVWVLEQAVEGES